ncbi:MAG: AAA family ATPase [Candidatus Micrarchaeota archaeon]|nr:AAA family ATPase [Candidatus Micrarchaeota archaeon]
MQQHLSNLSNLLVKEKIQTQLEKISNNQKFVHAFAIFLLSFNIFFGLSFADLLHSLLFSAVFFFLALFLPKLTSALVLLFCFFALSNISPLLGWAYLFSVGVLFYFEFLSNWALFIVGHLAVLFPITFSYFGSAGAIFLLAFSSYYFGSRKGLILSALWIIFSILLSYSIAMNDFFGFLAKNPSFSLPVVSNFSLAKFFSSLVGAIASLFSANALLGFFPFFISLILKLFEQLFAGAILYLFFWPAVFFSLPKLYVFLKQTKKEEKFILTISSAALFLLFLSHLIYSFSFSKQINFGILFYVVFAVVLFFVLDFFAIPICNEFKLIALQTQKSFGKFGLQNLTLVDGGPSSLDDVGGYKQLKEELLEAIAVPLKQPELSKAYKLDPVKGILLFGPPGTGKTLIISALAKELNLPFYYVKCSDILSSWYGESEKNISELFSIARKNAPCIIFIDEIDAIARSRDLFFTDDIGPRVLSVLLAEMDGIKSSYSKPVIIIGATNVPNKLDSALLRPGRLDKIIYMPLPDKEARLEILKVHSSKLNLASDVNLEEIAALTENYSGADLANLIQEAKRLAIRESRAKNTLIPISQKHLLSLVQILKPSVSEEQLLLYKKFEQEYKRSIS